MTEEKIGFKYGTIRMTKAAQFKMLQKHIKDKDQERLAMIDETHIYNFGGLPVELTLPKGDYTEDFNLSLKITYKLGLDIWEYAHRS